MIARLPLAEAVPLILGDGRKSIDARCDLVEEFMRAQAAGGILTIKSPEDFFYNLRAMTVGDDDDWQRLNGFALMGGENAAAMSIERHESKYPALVGKFIRNAIKNESLEIQGGKKTQFFAELNTVLQTKTRARL